MKQQLQDQLRAAMKSRDEIRMMTIRGILAEITRLEKDVRRQTNEAEIVQIIKRERARREEALEFARKANRADLTAQYEAEAEILDGYLPAALGADELKSAIAGQIASGANQIGPIMKALKEKFGARLDGKAASDLIRQALGSK